MNKRPIMKALSGCAVLFALVFCGGCSTIVTLHGPEVGDWIDVPDGAYRGVRLDGPLIVDSETPGLLRVLCVVDLPLSTVADTIVLPYTLTTLGPSSLRVIVVMEKFDPSGHASFVGGYGGQWRLDRGQWQNSGAIVSGLKPGLYEISFSPVKGWQMPDSQYLNIVGKHVTTMTGTYKSFALPGDATNSKTSTRPQ